MDTQNSLYEVPTYVKEYCKNRITEIVEYLNETQYSRYIRDNDVKVRVLDGNKGNAYMRCLVTRKVLPTTVLKNPMLLRAAELEYKTWNGENPISLQEARWILIDEYPKTNCINEPYSCLELIRRRRNQFKLCLSDCIRVASERRFRLCTV